MFLPVHSRAEDSSSGIEPPAVGLRSHRRWAFREGILGFGRACRHLILRNRREESTVVDESKLAGFLEGLECAGLDARRGADGSRMDESISRRLRWATLAVGAFGGASQGARFKGCTR